MAESVELIARVRRRFLYDKRTGELIHIYGEHAGKIAGAICTKGYRQIKIDGISYMAHRLIWMWVKGVLPKGQIDHKDTDKNNSRIENLRDVSGDWNQQNRAKPLASNKSSGVLGVHRWGKRWVAHIRTGGRRGKLIHLGVFDTVTEAGAAYLQAKISLHPGSVL